MARRFSNVALAVVAAVQLALLLLVHRSAPEDIRSQLLPELRSGEVKAIALIDPDRATIEVEMTERGPMLRAPETYPADPMAVSRLAAALENLTAHRRLGGRGGDAALGLDPDRSHRRIAITLAGRAEAIELRIGDGASDGGSLWVARSGGRDAGAGDAFAVGRSLLSAFPESVDDLRARDLLTRIGSLQRVTLTTADGEVVVDVGAGRVEFAGTRARLGVAPARNLVQALGKLHLQTFEDGAVLPSGPGHMVIAAQGDDGAEEISVHGPCGADGGQLTRSSAGLGCVDGRLVERLSALASDRLSLVDRRLSAPVATQRVELTAGHRSVIGERATQGAAIDRWLRQLDGVVTAVTVESRGWPLVATAQLTGVDGSRSVVEFHRGAQGLLARRRGESVYLSLSEQAERLITPEPIRWRSLALVDLERSSLKRVVVRRQGRVVEELVRGHNLEQWTAVQPATAVPVKEDVERLRELAQLSALDVVAGAPSPPHRLASGAREISLTFDPAPGQAQETVVSIKLGRRTVAGCLIQLAGESTVFEVEADTCVTLRGPLAR